MNNIIKHIGWDKYHKTGRSLFMHEKELIELIISNF